MPIPAVLHVLPRMSLTGEIIGWRACAARVPGCTVFLQDRDKATKMINDAIIAIIEEEAFDCSN